MNIGGAERALQKLLLSGKISRQNVKVISLTSKGIFGTQLVDEGFQVIALEMKNILSLPSVIYRIVKIIRKFNPDIVQCWLYHADLIGGVAAKISGVKNIIWGIRSTDLKKGSYITSIVRRLCALFSYFIPTKIICVANASKIKHVSLGYSERKMVVICNGFTLSTWVVDEERVNNFKQKYNINKSQIVIGSVGRFSSIKGHDLFVEAAGIIMKKNPNILFLMIGLNIDENNQQLMEWINATCNKDQFVLLGERNDIPVCLAAMDIFCLHSRSEGFPNILGEAMSTRLACISSDVGDSAYLLSDTGLIVERCSSEALANGLNELITNPKEKNEILGIRAMKRIEENFTLEETSKKFYAVYRELLSSETEIR